MKLGKGAKNQKADLYQQIIEKAKKIDDKELAQILSENFDDNRKQLKMIEKIIKKNNTPAKVIQTKLQDYLVQDSQLVSMISQTYQIEGNPMYLLSSEFCQAIFDDQEYTKEINLDLIDSSACFLPDPSSQKQYQNIILQNGLREQEHYILVTQELWDLVKMSFNKHIEVKRFVHAIDPSSSEMQVEVTLVQLNLLLDQKDFVVQLSKYDRGEDLISKIKRYTRSNYVGLWIVDVEQIDQVQEMLVKDEVTQVEFKQLKEMQYITQYPICLDEIIVIDHGSSAKLLSPSPASTFLQKFQKELSLIQSNPDKLISDFSRAVLAELEKEEEEQEKLREEQPNLGNTQQELYKYLECDIQDMLEGSSRQGLVGLQNIGNTCFMNSALQCLSNTVPLTKYFLLRLHEFEINSKNPLGTGGKLTQSYADLINDLWQKSSKKTIPWSFKGQIAKRASQFQGFAQQDSAELLTYVLDALHEDLNLIDKKPYVEFNDRDDRPDHIVSQEFWNGFLKRNQSIIVNLMYGQLKSRLECEQCKRVSTTFDPFLTLQVPIPVFQVYKIYFQSLDWSKPIQEFCLQINDDQSVKEVKDILAHKLSLPANRLVIARYEDFEVQEYFKSQSYFRTATFRGGMIIVNELDDTIENVQSDQHGFVEVIIKQTKKGLLSSSDDRISPSKILTFTSSDSVSQVKQKLKKLLSKVASPQFKINILNNLPSQQGVLSSSKVECDLCGVSHSEDCEWIVHDEENRIAMEVIKERKYRREFMIVVQYPNDVDTSKLTQIHTQSKAIIKVADVMKGQSKDFGDDKTGKVSLYDCLDQFRTNELLTGDDKWYCSQCQDHVNARKKMEVYKTPQILVVQLKRFIQQKSQYFYAGVSRKISDHIEYPTRGLDLTDYVKSYDPKSNGGKRLQYDLYGVVNHFGSLYGGHYTSYAKNVVFDEWYEYDDSRVSKAREADVVSKAGYVLFYKRRD